ncbi:MAG: hypothetical protein P1V97_19840 [Planctomycetota bacterium]|nr:hypothetical protein [Planctomycetota bacterium]
MLRRVLILLPFLLMLCLSGFADELIRLKDGTEYRGQIIIESPARIVLKTSKGKVTIEKALIKERRKALSTAEEFQARASKIREGDAEAWRGLARWSKAQGLSEEALDCYKKILEQRPDDAEAKKAVAAAKAEEAKAEEAESADETARRQLKETLEDTQVHFDFARANIPTIINALASATGVAFKVDKSAMKDLKKRRVSLRYKSDHTAYRCLMDVTKHAKLDFFITKQGVVVGTRSSINRLRKKLGIKKKKIRILSASEALKVMDTSKHTLRCTKKKFSSVLTYFRRATPLKYFFDGPKEDLEKLVTFDVYQRPLRSILDKVFEPLGLDFMLQGNVVYIASKEKIAAIRPKDLKKDAKKAPKKEND